MLTMDEYILGPEQQHRIETCGSCGAYKINQAIFNDIFIVPKLISVVLTVIQFFEELQHHKFF